jgi:hypothetical protein
LYDLKKELRKNLIQLSMGVVAGYMGWVGVASAIVLWDEKLSIVEVRDHALWVKHIHGNESLKEKILSLSQGELIKLVVDGCEGTWVKMEDGKDGRPTQGLKGVGIAREKWHELNDRRGSLVSITEDNPDEMGK